jgi:hypothetical protein
MLPSAPTRRTDDGPGLATTHRIRGRVMTDFPNTTNLRVRSPWRVHHKHKEKAMLIEYLDRPPAG